MCLRVGSIGVLLFLSGQADTRTKDKKMELNTNTALVKEISNWAKTNWKHAATGDLEALIFEAFDQITDDLENGETGVFELRANETVSGRPETLSVF
jgi:hypothetical protein